MKNSLFILFSVLTLTVSAQVFKTGVILGLNASQVEGDGLGGYNKLGIIAGGFANANISANWSTQFEIYYTGKGSRKNAKPDKGILNSFKLKLDYVEIPVAIRYHYKKFLFEAGLYYGVLLNSHMENEFGKIAAQNFPFKKYDIGGFFGIHYRINDRFSCNIRSKNSILPIRDFDNLDENVGIFNKLFNRGWYNVEINFSVRYQFGS